MANFTYRDLTGQRFGKLVAISRGPDRRFKDLRAATWNVRCDCGNLPDNLRKSRAKSKRGDFVYNGVDRKDSNHALYD